MAAAKDLEARLAQLEQALGEVAHQRVGVQQASGPAQLVHDGYPALANLLAEYLPLRAQLDRERAQLDRERDQRQRERRPVPASERRPIFGGAA